MDAGMQRPGQGRGLGNREQRLSFSLFGLARTHNMGMGQEREASGSIPRDDIKSQKYGKAKGS